MRIETINIVGGKPNRYEVGGQYFEIIDAPYVINVRFEDSQGRELVDASMFNVESGIFNFIDFRAFTIVSATTQVLRVLISDKSGGSRRQPGVVSIIDGGKARTLAGLAFSGYVGSNALASNNSHCQLWNPTTTKNIIVEQVAMTLSLSSGVFIRVSSAACATLGAAAQSKKLGGAASVAELRSQQNAAVLGSSNLGALSLLAGTPFLYTPKEPIIIPPAFGLMVVAGSQNVGVDATYEYYEDIT